MLTNLRDAFVGQSWSPNIAPFYMLGIGFLLWNSNFVFKIFTIFVFEKCCDLDIGVSHSRSLKVAPFDRLCMVSY